MDEWVYYDGTLDITTPLFGTATTSQHSAAPASTNFNDGSATYQIVTDGFTAFDNTCSSTLQGANWITLSI